MAGRLEHRTTLPNTFYGTSIGAGEEVIFKCQNVFHRFTIGSPSAQEFSKVPFVAERPMSQAAAWRMIRRRAKAARHQGAHRLPYLPCHQNYGVSRK